MDLCSVAEMLTSRQRTVKFINSDAASIHGSLKVGSVYTSESGEWKLGGFDVLSSVKDDESIIYVGTDARPSNLRLTFTDIWWSGARFGSILPT